MMLPVVTTLSDISFRWNVREMPGMTVSSHQWPDGPNIYFSNILADPGSWQDRLNNAALWCLGPLLRWKEIKRSKQVCLCYWSHHVSSHHVSNLLFRIVKEEALRAQRTSPERPVAGRTNGCVETRPIDILELLSKAKEEYHRVRAALAQRHCREKQNSWPAATPRLFISKWNWVNVLSLLRRWIARICLWCWHCFQDKRSYVLFGRNNELFVQAGTTDTNNSYGSRIDCPIWHTK